MGYNRRSRARGRGVVDVPAASSQFFLLIALLSSPCAPSAVVLSGVWARFRYVGISHLDDFTEFTC